MRLSLLLFFLIILLGVTAFMPAAAHAQTAPAPESKVRLVIVEISYSTDPDGIRVSAEVTNNGSETAKNVMAKCVLLTDDGKLYNTSQQKLGAMKPGEKVYPLFFIPGAGGLKRVLSVEESNE
ncbi:MAG: hypothetical protein RDV48_27340 [Candidatus Eremiobacteraeota bacterium]|nr:hypothetical protein [Candidatus Eremiobacteraeota bacterium]